MQFKDLKIGYPVYILDKSSICMHRADIVSVGSPYFPPVNRTPQQQSPFNGNIQRLVDITVNKNGQNHVYVVNECSELCYCGDEVVTSESKYIVNEIQVIRKNAEQQLSLMTKYKESVTKCCALLSDLDENEKRNQQNEERLNSLDEKLEKLSCTMEKLVNKFNSRI